MGIKFGEIDAAQIVSNEFKIRVLERLLEFILNNNHTIIKPSQSDVLKIQQDVVAELKKKYPKSGVEFHP